MKDTLLFVLSVTYVAVAIDLIQNALGQAWDKLSEIREVRRDHWLPEYPNYSKPEPEPSPRPGIWFHTVPKRRTTSGAFAERAALAAWAWVDDHSEPMYRLPGIKMTKEWTKCKAKITWPSKLYTSLQAS